MSTPIQFRRSEYFYIESIIQLNCKDSLSTITQWTVKSNDSFPMEIFTTFSELFIPARTLPYGIHELELIVTMTDYPWLTTTTSVFVQIIRTNIIPNLVQFGTGMITHGYEHDLLLDPGKYSIDSDENIFNFTVNSNTLLRTSLNLLLIELEI